MNLTSLIVPAVIAGVLIYGVCTKTDVFTEFTAGVREGLHTVYDIFPSLFCLVVTVGAFRASGASEVITGILAPALGAIGFPPECGTLLILRPFSGSGSIAIFEQILTEFGPDSFPGRVASVILGSSETTFYTLSVYFASVKAKKTRYALAAALIGDITCALVSAAAVNLMLDQ